MIDKIVCLKIKRVDKYFSRIGYYIHRHIKYSGCDKLDTAKKLLKPHSNLKLKYILVPFLINTFGWIISNLYWYLSDGNASRSFYVFYVKGYLFLGAFLIVASFQYAYCNSISYELMEKEVIIRRGVITKTNKFIPYRTITNVEVKRDPLDRLLNIGYIELETAGYSSKKGPEGKIEGVHTSVLESFQNEIINKVRLIRGSSGISHDTEDTVFTGILNEIKDLKSALINQK